MAAAAMKSHQPSEDTDSLTPIMPPDDGQGAGEAGRGLRIAGLFAGIGGVELGLGRAGHRTELLCEWDPAAQKVLEARFPDIPLHDDVQTLRDLPQGIDMITGGFPCQDLSQAGTTRGIEGLRSGLVKEVFRLVDSTRPRHVLLENVPFMLRLEQGRAMHVLIEAFESRGFRWAYRTVDTRAFGIPQRRQRVIFLASLSLDPAGVLLTDDAGDEHLPTEGEAYGFYWTEGLRGLGTAVDSVPTLKGGSTIGIPSPPAILRPDQTVVTPDIRDAERLQGFDVDWTAPAEEVARRGARWKLVGNAVTVDLFEWVGRRLAIGEQAWTPPPLVGPINGKWPSAAFGSRGFRWASNATHFPVARTITPILQFLRFTPKPLSLRATTGFLSRLERSTLRTPVGFREGIRSHLESMATMTA